MSLQCALQGVAYLVAGLMVLSALPRLETALDLAATRP
jgi:hypothetical protein